MGVQRKTLFLIWMVAVPIWAQSPAEPDWRRVVERLERLEEQNKQLLSEVRALRDELSGKMGTPPSGQSVPLPPAGEGVGTGTLASGQSVPLPPAGEGVGVAAPPPLAERVEVLEQRAADHEQSKLDSEHRLPVQLSGMLLFNAFVNGRNAGGNQMPLVASLTPDPSPVNGGTFRQSILGFKFQGPKIFAGGEVTGSFSLDLFGGSGVPLNQALRLRVATVDLNWTNTTLSVAHDKPLMAPREPVSLAQMGVSPLTAAGNLWFWQPQIRIEQRFHFGEFSGLRAQMGVIQTNDAAATTPAEYQNTLANTRPGLEGRFELWRQFRNGGRIEIAPGFHLSNTHVAGQIVPSRVYSVDWLIRPFTRVDLTGTWFYNQNSTILGGLRPGLLFLPNGVVRPVIGSAEWAQLTIRATSRATFNFYGGQASNHASDVRVGSLLNNRTWAGNIIYKLGTNVLASFEVYQARSLYVDFGRRLVPHYDLALAYLF